MSRDNNYIISLCLNYSVALYKCKVVCKCPYVFIFKLIVIVVKYRIAECKACSKLKKSSEMLNRVCDYRGQCSPTLNFCAILPFANTVLSNYKLCVIYLRIIIKSHYIRQSVMLGWSNINLSMQDVFYNRFDNFRWQYAC